MNCEYDPLPVPEEEKTVPDDPDGTAVITVGDYYDLLMEQQEQM